jgi:YfiH family protein
MLWMTILYNLKANWPAPSNIYALTTTRLNGFSQVPYNENNFGLHVGDSEINVLKNRQQLQELLALPNEPAWLSQTHSTTCVVIENESNREADAAVTRCKTQTLAVMTADCLPITLCNMQGNEIAVIHAGWRGLVHGIIEQTLTRMQSNSSQILAWIGPAICSRCFEVGDEVYLTYIKQYPFVRAAFQKQRNNKWLANLALLAELVFNHLGVNQVYHSNQCTMENEQEYYSYRKNAQTGRMVTLIWMK